LTILLGLGGNRRLDLGPVHRVGFREEDRIVLSNGTGTTITVAGPLAAPLAKILSEITSEGMREVDPQRTPRGAEMCLDDLEHWAIRHRDSER
jgi:hypothetical protein